MNWQGNLTIALFGALDEELLEGLINTLNEQQKKVIRMRFGIYCEAKTLKEIGELIERTPSRVQQIENKALRIMRNKLRDIRERMGQHR